MPVPAASASAAPAQQVQPQNQKQGRRRRTLRPSLSTISEALDEPPAFPVLTPGPKARADGSSPMKSMKRVNGLSTPADKLKTPTKVAESPMKNFTITVTHVSGGPKIEVTNPGGHFRVPSPTNTEATTASHPVDQSPSKSFNVPATTTGDDIDMTNTDAPLRASSDVYTDTTLASALSSSDYLTRRTESINTYHTALPFFDAPVAAGVQDEPEHESKRRISMDNARRNDRRPSVKTTKRVAHWIAGLHASHDKKRRHSELPQDLEVSASGEKNSRRRHTLDVDVGRNLDIFGAQTATQQVEKEEHRESKQWARRSLVSEERQTLQDLTVAEPISSKSTIGGSTISESTVPVPVSQPVHLMDDHEDPLTSEDEGIEQQSEVDAGPTFEMDISADVGDIMDGIIDQIVNDIQDSSASIASQNIDANAASLKLGKSLAPSAAQDKDLFLPANEDDLEGDSALADLHNFVRRAKSSKERHDTQTSMILPSSNFAVKKRRSGSMNSATSGTGSPMGKIEKMTTTASLNTASPRVPLGEKDANKSPSPAKKRKLKGGAEPGPIVKKKHNRLVAPDLEDYDTEPAQPKKRRRKIEADTEDIFNPDIAFGQDLTKRASSSSFSSSSSSAPMADGPGSRRSSRIKKAVATAIPVRFSSAGPTGAMLDDMPTVSTAAVTNAALTRKANKDLAAETRTNTQKNKSGAVAVAVALATMAAAGAGEAGGAGEDEITTVVSGPRPGGAKSVRWAEILARVQGEDVEVVTATKETVAAAEAAEVEEKEKETEREDDEESALPPPPQLRLADESRPSNPVASQLGDEQEEQQSQSKFEIELRPESECKSEKKTASAAAAPRRSSRAAVSRLPTRGGGMAPAGTPAKKISALHGPSVVTTNKGRGGASATAAAGARARLGMAGPGTPAPRRGGRRGGRRG